MEFKELSIYREKLKFPDIDDRLMILEEKVNALIMTARLMGYTIRELYGGFNYAGRRYTTYSIVLKKENKRVELEFKRVNDVVSRVWFNMNLLDNVFSMKSSEGIEEALRVLDELLTYI